MFPRARVIAIGSIAAVLLLIATTLTAVLAKSPAHAAALSSFPNSGNTGLTNPGALTVHNGSLEVTQDGALIQNLEIRGMVTIKAKNVVMRNVWVYTSNPWSIYVEPGKSLLIEDSEIGHPSHPGFRGIGGNNVTARRLDIHHVEDGIKADNNSLYDRVYCHDLASPAGSPHADCFQDDGGHHDYTVRNSTLDARFSNGSNGNAAIIVKSEWARSATRCSRTTTSTAATT